MEEHSDSKVTELRRPPEEHGESFYVVGGPVQPRRGCYVERPADRQLLEGLHDGEYCHVLAPPQVGKSSLMARTARELRRQSFLTAVVDLSQTIGKAREGEAGRWYYGLAYRIVRDLRLPVDLQHWWQEKKPLTAMQRINEFFWDVVLANTRMPVVIFLDEIESVADRDYAADLFHAVRACHDARASEPEYERLTFALFGTALPGEPASGSGGSLFDVGRRIELNDFTFEEARLLCREIGLEKGDAERALYRVFYWTGGQPYLSQKLCRAISRNPGSVESDDDVDGFVSSRFLSGNAPQNEPNLRRVRAAAEKGGNLAYGALRIYRRLRKARRIRFDRHQPEHEWLRVTGLASVSADGVLQVRNRIYTEVFNARWIRNVVPFNWRGAGRWAAILTLAIGIPYWYSQVLPKGYVKTLTRPGMEFAEVQEAYLDLRRLPGFGDLADSLFARVLESRSLAADSWDDALAADVELRSVGGYADQADRLLGAFWGRQSDAAAAEEMRDQALIYRLRALETGARRGQPSALPLIGQDYPLLVTGIRPGARIDGLGIDPAGRSVVTLTEGHVVQTWDAATGAPTGLAGGFPALAEEFTTIRRRAGVESAGAVRELRLEVMLSHPQATDVEMRLVAPSGRSIVLPIPRQQRQSGVPYVFDVDGTPELRTFRREQVRGSWTLELEDQLTGTTGFLEGWVLSFSGQAGDRVEDAPGNPILLPDPRPTSRVQVVLSPDGRRAAAVGANQESRGFLQVWDTSTGGVTARIPVKAGPRIVAFDVEGQYLVTGSIGAPGHLSIWRAAAGQELLGLDSPDGFLTQPVLSATGSVLAVAETAGNGNSRIRLLDLVSGEERAPVEVGGVVSAIALGPDGRTVAALHVNKVVDLWDADDGRLLAQLAHDRPVGRMIFGPSGRWLATVEQDSMVRVWSLGSGGEGDPAGLLVSRESWDPLSLTFSDDGGLLLMRGRGRTFEVLSLPSGMPAAPPLRHSGDWRPHDAGPLSGRQVSRAFGADNSLVVTGRGGTMARVWRMAPPAGSQATAGSGIAVAQVFAISPISDQITAGGPDGVVRFLDRGTPWEAIPEGMPSHAGSITALAYSRDGSRLASVGADGSVLLWDPLSAVTVGERFHHGSGRVGSVAVAADNRRILTGGELGARLWDGETGEPGPVLGPGRRVTGVAFSGDGQLAYTASAEGLVQAWCTGDGAPMWSGSMSGTVWSLAVAPDGRWVAAGSGAGQLYLWDRQRLIGSRRVVQINGWPLSLDFDPRVEALYVQTGEWLHALSLGERPAITASALLPGTVHTKAWTVPAEGFGSTRMLTVDSNGHRIVQLDMHGTDRRRAVGDPDPEARWLDRLKLRFDATGALVPVEGTAPLPAEAGEPAPGKPAALSGADAAVRRPDPAASPR